VKPVNRVKGPLRRVGEGEEGKKAKATQHAGGQSVSEKSQTTRTSKNLFVLPFIHTCMKSLAEHGSINQPWFGPGNPRCEPVSSTHESIKTTRLSIREDLEDRWVTNLN